MYRQPNKKRISFKPTLVLIVIVVLLVIGLAISEITNTTHLLHKQALVSGTIQTSHTNSPSNSKATSSSKTSASSSTGTTTPSNTDTSTKVNNPAPTGNTALVTPYGTFVSNHRPSISGSSAPSEEQSTCTTTPGASCSLKLTKDGITKTLAAQTTDQSGTTYWDWDVKKNGFETGTWQITAVATLNNQTKSAQDSANLEVQP
jgi:hypothetical protein